jgi:uroporphyrinogen-III synthase
MSFSGKRVLSLESRRATETAELIRRNGGEPFVAPSIREVPLSHNEEALLFGTRLLAGDFEMVILTTGVGTRILVRVLATRYSQDQITDALRRVTTVARGPKPVAALREMGMQPTLVASEPNTWKEIIAVVDGRPERRVAVQEYGRMNPELHASLRERGFEVTPVPVYQWQYPEDLTPLREAAQQLAAESFDVVMLTSSVQVEHLLHTADEMGLEQPVRRGIRTAVIASIGPTTSDTLREYGFTPDLEASHPKLGLLVKEAAEQSGRLLAQKRT